MLLKRYFWAINLGLITLLVWVSVDILLVHVTARLEDRPLPRVPAAAALLPPEKKPRPHFDLITAQNIFDPYHEGHVEVPKSMLATAPPPPPPPPPLSTKLKLKGTVAGDEQTSIAILDDLESRKQVVVKVRGNVKGATLLSVVRDKAVFEFNGRQETLTLVEKDAPTPSGPMASRSRPVLAGRPGMTPPPAAVEPAPAMPPPPSRTEVVKAVSPSRYVINRGGLGKVAANPGDMNKELQFRSNASGLLIDSVPPGGLADKAGLRPGDIVKRINGRRVSNADEARLAYQQAINGPVVRVEVERQKRPITMTYELR